MSPTVVLVFIKVFYKAPMQLKVQEAGPLTPVSRDEPARQPC